MFRFTVLVDACSLCHPDADCVNHRCVCKPHFIGDGIHCKSKCHAPYCTLLFCFVCFVLFFAFLIQRIHHAWCQVSIRIRDRTLIGERGGHMRPLCVL